MGPRFGAHMSVAGGLPNAIERALLHRCDALQIFTKNANQWRGRVVPVEETAEFRLRAQAAAFARAVSHASYLINLAAPAGPLRDRSIDAMGDELDRAASLDLQGVVLHPGAYGSGTRAGGLTLVAEALLDLVRTRRHGKTMILLEQTAGQGTSLGSTFEDLAEIIERTRGHERIGICLDTCHLLAAGYDLTSAEGYADAFAQFERLIGFRRLHVLHVNDSKKPLGSRVDRHTHIGEGHLGLDAFRRLVNDPRLHHVPMLLETPKEDRGGRTQVVLDPFDEKNLATLRGLVEASASGA